MSSQSPSRLSNIALLGGSLFLAVGTIGAFFLPASDTNHQVILMAWLRFIGVLFLILGLPGVFARYADRTKVLGTIGFALVQLFFLIEILDYFVAAVIRPYLAAHIPTQSHPPIGLFLVVFLIGPLLGAIGDIVYGIATLRSQSQLRAPGILLLVGGVFLVLSGILPQGASASLFGAVVLLNLVVFVWLSMRPATASGGEQAMAQPASMRA